MLPKDIVEAHDKGIIHFHDLDYSPLMPETNCCLVNLADMLQNGTQISGVTIDKPRSFSTACNIATQIIAQVASSQYGGQTITLSHLAPFVDVSRQKIKARITSTIPNADAEDYQ
jgi:anaerobic ribonucleoside-triphosphate reductase